VSYRRQALAAALTLTAAGALAAASPPAAAPAATPAAGTTAAEWMTHRILVSLTDLPRGYSCNDLWYRFKDVMLAIGAQQLQILTYDCPDKNPQPHGSPKVELKFQFPTVLTGDNVRYADFQGTPTSVHFAPGAPASLTADDCALVQQMAAGIFDALSVKVTESKFPCATSAAAGEPYRVTVLAVLPPAAAPHS
jgi:hypothetical protein